MKRMIPLFLLLAILLCACGKTKNTKPAATTAPTQATEPEEVPPVTVYVPDSPVQTQTDNAVRQYDGAYAWIAPFEGGVLTATAGEKTTLSVLTGPEGTLVVKTELPVQLDAKAVCQVIPGGFTYYDAEKRELAILDEKLSEVSRIALPENVTGDPAIAQDGSVAYYCVEETVYAVDLRQRIIRPVRTNACKEQTLLGCYLDGSVVACRMLNMVDQWETVYVSGKDGRLLHKDNSVKKVYSSGDTYFALRADGSVEQYIYGNTTDTATPMQLNIAAHSAFGVLEQGGVIGQTTNKDGVTLSFYNMKKTAAVTLPQDYTVAQVAADAGAVWLLTQKGTLLRWELKSTPVTEDVDYTSTVYTADNPDTAGLKACAKRGDDLGDKHGVTIRVFERALVSNDDYDIEVEYQTAAINRALDELETVLNKYPTNFLYRSVNRTIRICIVRSIGGQQVSAYHWFDGDPFIILSVGMDFEQAFLDALSYIVDIHILGNSSEVDNWAELNPQGFAYGKDQAPESYPGAFVDAKAMESLTDDRARTFFYAMQEGNEKLFETETMQKKLLMLCKGIRDAWRWEKKTETYPWEQYLKEPIVPQK